MTEARPHFRSVATALHLLLLSASATATRVFYVSNAHGSDSSSGASRGQAFATVVHCVAVAPAGSTCVLAGGDYQEDFPLEIKSDLTIEGDSRDPTAAGGRALELCAIVWAFGLASFSWLRAR